MWSLTIVGYIQEVRDEDIDKSGSGQRMEKRGSVWRSSYIEGATSLHMKISKTLISLLW
jgi:hypothetical protein